MNSKGHFLMFVADMTANDNSYVEAANRDRQMAERIKEFDPKLAALVIKTVEARLEVSRYLHERAER